MGRRGDLVAQEEVVVVEGWTLVFDAVRELVSRADGEEDGGWTTVFALAGELSSRAGRENDGGWTADICEASPHTCSVGVEERAERALLARAFTGAVLSSTVATGGCARPLDCCTRTACSNIVSRGCCATGLARFPL
jgi:hypothetical protein